jgi:hypothetical protein
VAADVDAARLFDRDLLSAHSLQAAYHVAYNGGLLATPDNFEQELGQFAPTELFTAGFGDERNCEEEDCASTYSCDHNTPKLCGLQHSVAVNGISVKQLQKFIEIHSRQHFPNGAHLLHPIQTVASGAFSSLVACNTSFALSDQEGAEDFDTGLEAVGSSSSGANATCEHENFCFIILTTNSFDFQAFWLPCCNF